MGNVIDGLHLVVDGTVRDEISFSEHNLHALFQAMARALDMTIIEGPKLKQVPVDPAKLNATAFVDEGGISGYCMISTSHISIHCWPLRKIFMADILSCKQFDEEKALTTLYEMLGVSMMHAQVIRRVP